MIRWWRDRLQFAEPPPVSLAVRLFIVLVALLCGATSPLGFSPYGWFGLSFWLEQVQWTHADQSPVSVSLLQGNSSMKNQRASRASDPAHGVSEAIGTRAK